jgi:DNA primase
MSTTVEKIKERLSIVDVISSYIKLTPQGGRYTARCPFHNEKTPSFSVSPDLGGYYCFGCNQKGDIFTFVQEFEGVDFKGALKILAERAGVVIDYSGQKSDSKDRLFLVMEEATKFFQNNLVKEKSVLDYLKQRGLTDETIEQFKIGFISQDWRLLYTYLQSKKFTDIEIERVGLVKKTDKGYYDRFRSRIMFPIADSSGRIVAFTGRIFLAPGVPQTGEEQAKYVNSPETELFSKSKVLYGFDKAKFNIKKREYAILVEGQIDLIMSHQAGFTNTVASSGTALTDSGLEIIGRLTNNIMIAYDRDRAGIEAARRAAGMAALARDMIVKVVTIPGGKDPADAILESETIWKEAITNAEDIIDFEISTIVSSKENVNSWIAEIKKRVFPYIRALPSQMRIDHYLSQVIVPKIGLSADSVRNEFMQYMQANPEQFVSSNNQNVTINQKSRLHSILRTLYGLMELEKIKKSPNIDPDQIRIEIENIFGPDSISSLDSKTEDEKRLMIFEAEKEYRTDNQMDKNVRELLLNLEEEYLLERYAKKQQVLRIAEHAKDQESLERLLVECKTISNTITELKKRRIT